MTCIIAVRDKKNKVWLAGDKMASNGISHYLVKDPKVFQVGDFYFGFTDSFYMGQLLKYSFVPPERQEGISDSQYLFQDVRVALTNLFDQNEFGIKDRGTLDCPDLVFGEFLMVYKERIFLVQANMSFLEYDITTCGSGAQVAQGVLLALMENTDLSMEETLTKTMDIVGRNCVGVSKELDIIQCS